MTSNTKIAADYERVYKILVGSDAIDWQELP